MDKFHLIQTGKNQFLNLKIISIKDSEMSASVDPTQTISTHAQTRSTNAPTASTTVMSTMADPTDYISTANLFSDNASAFAMSASTENTLFDNTFAPSESTFTSATNLFPENIVEPQTYSFTSATNLFPENVVEPQTYSFTSATNLFPENIVEPTFTLPTTTGTATTSKNRNEKPNLLKSKNRTTAARRRANSVASSQLHSSEPQPFLFLDSIHKIRDLIADTSKMLNENLFVLDQRINLLDQKVDSHARIARFQLALFHSSGTN